MYKHIVDTLVQNTMNEYKAIVHEKMSNDSTKEKDKRERKLKPLKSAMFF